MGCPSGRRCCSYEKLQQQGWFTYHGQHGFRYILLILQGMWPYFKTLQKEDLQELVQVRAGEEKLGERVRFGGADAEAMLQDPAIHYVLLGIPEDIGVRANLGMGGAHTLWRPFLKSFLNVQTQADLSPEDVLVLGAFDFQEWMAEAEDADVSRLRELTAMIDDAVTPVIRDILAAGKLPVVIGGGHNNAFPLLRGASAAFGGSINCLNLDAHTDYRKTEGRHSGNGFRYAKENTFLHRYAAIALHRNYNNERILREFQADATLHASFYDDVVSGRLDFRTLVQEGIAHVADRPTGLELDMDCIAGVLSSAATPSGITVPDARYYMAACAQHCKLAYVHLTEGATALRDGRKDATTAKLAAYLITDLLRYVD